ncbi:MAG: thioesterase family protein [Alsobacter sp.]
MGGHVSPLPVGRWTVQADWVDYNGHLNDAYYAVVFSRSVDALMDRLGLDAAGRAATGHTIYTAALMIRYVREVKAGEPLDVDVQVLESDAKRLRVWLTMRHGLDGHVVATSEQLLLSIDASGPRTSPWPKDVGEAVAALTLSHAGIPAPPEAGQGISLKRR